MWCPVQAPVQTNHSQQQSRLSDKRANAQGQTLFRGGHLYRLPEFDGVSFGILKMRKAAIRIGGWVYLDGDACSCKLSHQPVQIANPKIQHPPFRSVEVARLFREGRK